ncbi:hypothetical protein LshimejAT787_0702180 [Lyophyllum shimeji]|uniref:Uncharacterized protein n=1 Tax=Lyophyllum shimeji TaxID=47721 RepID=A0A9P3PQG5_LYOSH|nr:hypothetical protein LshimejAT787_0702180 [Lyophyllum shimeji]
MPPKPKNGKQKADPRSQTRVVERLQTALASAFSSGPPSSIKVPRGASKRKPALSEPGSDIEILDGPASPSPTKKKRGLPSRGTSSLQVPERKAIVASHLEQLGGPAAGTRDDSVSAARATIRQKAGSALPGLASPDAPTLVYIFLLAPTASIDIASYSAALAAAFGDRRTAEPMPAAHSPSGRPIRTRIKSEKAKLAEQSAAEQAAAEPIKKRKSLVEVRSEAQVARQRWEASQASAYSFSCYSGRSCPLSASKEKSEAPPADAAVRLATPAADDDSDDDLPDVAAMFSSSPATHHSKALRLPVSDDEEEGSVAPGTPPRNRNPFIDAEARDPDDAASDVEEGSEAASADESSDAHSQAAANASAPDEDAHEAALLAMASGAVDESSVMQPHLWHPEMVRDAFYDVAPFNNGGNQVDSMTMRVPVEALAAAMPREHIAYLAAGLAFERADRFVNTARIDPNELVVESGRLKLADSKRQVICVMMGIVTESFLFHPVLSGSQRSQTNTHKLTIAPAQQEMRRDTSVWGLLFDFPEPVIMGPSGDLGFSFSTYGEDKAPRALQGGSKRGDSAPATPQKTSKYAVQIKSPSVSKSTSTSVNPIAYEDTIPVYDGRPTEDAKGFLFTDADFQALPKWRRFEGNRSEIPVDSVVAVGYTVGTYGSLGSANARYLSSNIQFAIVFSTPASAVPTSQSKKARGLRT